MNIDQMRTGMANSLLAEISRALSALAATGTPSALDLRSLPLTAADRAALDAGLGRGDVAITLSASGTSEIWETGFCGVWWLRHLGADGKVASEVIEITSIPQIVTAHPDDISAAAQRLQSALPSPRQEPSHA